MKLLTNPILLRAMAVLLCANVGFVLVLFFARYLRRNIASESDLSEESSGSPEALPLHVYNLVIQQLKQQKHELLVKSQAEQHRARTSETFSQSVLANLSCGVLVFGSNGLVKSSNSAAKSILGFASTNGMSAQDIFRGSANAATHSAGDEDMLERDASFAAQVHAVLREGSSWRQVEGEYHTPAGEQRFLSMTVSPVLSIDGVLLGAACLINDCSELESIRREQQLRGEISAEMALQLRTSLAAISGFAQQLANSGDPKLSKQIASDIAHEAAQLDHKIGGFLAAKPKAKGAAAGGSSNR